MSNSRWFQRKVTGPDGEVYHVEATATGSPYSFTVTIWMDEPALDWEMNFGANQSYEGAPVSENWEGLVRESWNPSKQTVKFTPEIPDGATRTTVPLTWHQSYNPRATLSDNKILTQTTFVLPAKQALVCATQVLEEDSVKTLGVIAETVNHYQRTYDCAYEEAYLTWLYDIALVASDEDFEEVHTTVEERYGNAQGVVVGMFESDAISDTENRLGRVSPGWLSTSGYVSLSGLSTTYPTDYEKESDVDSVPPQTPKERTEALGDNDDLRDWRFRRRVLQRYGATCAVCGLDIVSPKGDPIVEAAHVHARGEGGPDEPENGIPLCPNHHWAYDRGWLALTDDSKIIVRGTSEQYGWGNFSKFDGEMIETDRTPSVEFIRQHRELHNIA